MSPNEIKGGRKVTASNNIYTVILALLFCIISVTTILVAYKCYAQYDTLFNIP
jgi:hypothetical protein